MATSLLAPGFRLNGDKLEVDNEFLCTKTAKPSDHEVLRDSIMSKTIAADNCIKRGDYAASVMLRAPLYRLPHLINFCQHGDINPGRAWEIARATWLQLDEIWRLLPLWETFFALDLPGRSNFMNEAEYIHLYQLPDEIKIYRGYDWERGRNVGRKGLSWSMSKIIASQYANQFKAKRMAQAVISKDDVIGYIGTRGHHEIVVKSTSCIVNQRAVNTVRNSNVMRYIEGAKHNHKTIL